MKVKLLKKIRKKISLWERNGIYYVLYKGKVIRTYDDYYSPKKELRYKAALDYYIKKVINDAKDIFGIITVKNKIR